MISRSGVSERQPGCRVDAPRESPAPAAAMPQPPTATEGCPKTHRTGALVPMPLPWRQLENVLAAPFVLLVNDSVFGHVAPFKCHLDVPVM